MEPILFLVIPCYNEEGVLPETNRCVGDKLRRMITDGVVSGKSRILYVNDGSRDCTWNIIQELYRQDEYVTGITLSRNKGHQNALLAGLMTAKEYADIVISMDADLQDDVEVLDKFVEEYKKGNDIVYGVRKYNIHFIQLSPTNSCYHHTIVLKSNRIEIMRKMEAHT